MPLDIAIKLVGGQARLAAALGIRQPSIHGWLAAKSAPIDRCPAIETATGGAVTCEQLRPDVTWQRDEGGNVTGYIVPVQFEQKAA